MHTIEPFFNWRHLYITSEDNLSPFYAYTNSEVNFTHAIYDHVIHPQWDDMGSPTLYLKILFADYDDGYAIIELMGEWNDCINNDIMTLKRDVIESLMDRGIDKFILIGENILNFHASDDSYYSEWFDELEDGWVAVINFREHVLTEMADMGVDYYFVMQGELSELDWRTKSPTDLFTRINGLVQQRLGA
ncbi:MAG: hypothetical protein ACI8ZO_001095 [Flavobacteriales bacterium]|jgi:hypothetical protein